MNIPYRLVHAGLPKLYFVRATTGHRATATADTSPCINYLADAGAPLRPTPERHHLPKFIHHVFVPMTAERSRIPWALHPSQFESIPTIADLVQDVRESCSGKTNFSLICFNADGAEVVNRRQSPFRAARDPELIHLFPRQKIR
jgi:hypothetical protein